MYVTYYANPGLLEPLGTKVMKKWGSKLHLGVLLETYNGEGTQGLFRGIYNDGLIHDSSKGVTVRAIAKALPPQITPDITIEIYDESTPVDQLEPAVSVDSKGAYTLKYKNRFQDKCDLEDPLSMSVARDAGMGIEIGMVVGRVETVVEREKVDMYRVVFSDGEGYLTTRGGIEYMRGLFLETPGLEPIVLVVNGI